MSPWVRLSEFGTVIKTNLKFRSFFVENFELVHAEKCALKYLLGLGQKIKIVFDSFLVSRTIFLKSLSENFLEHTQHA